MNSPRRRSSLIPHRSSICLHSSFCILHPFGLPAFLLLLALAFPVAALDVPPPPTQWATDRAGLLNPTELDLLNAKLRDFEQASGAQFFVYIFPALEGEAVEDFTIRCAEAWKVGQKKYDNGLILFVFARERVIRVEVGYGLEGAVTDAISSRAIREYIAPHFRGGNHAAGLNAGADFLIATIRKTEAPVPPLQSRDSDARRQGETDLDPATILVILFIIFFVVVPMLTRRRSGCGGCIFPFVFPGGGITFGGGGGGFSSGGFGGGGGFSGGGGGSFGGGGATGSW